MIKNLTCFTFDERFNIGNDTLAEKVEAAEHKPCIAEQLETHGFKRQGQNQLFTRVLGDFIFITHLSEKKSVPGDVLKYELEKQVMAVAEDTGEMPSKKEIREMKNKLKQELLRKVLPKISETLLWIDTKNNTLNIDTSSKSKAERVLKTLSNAVTDLPRARYIETKFSVSSAMSDWILDVAPEEFMVDDTCQLIYPNEDGGDQTIKYIKHSLDGEEIKSYISMGRVPVSLALTFNERYPFTLTKDFIIKGLGMNKTAKEERSVEDESEVADLLLGAGTMQEIVLKLKSAIDGE